MPPPDLEAECPRYDNWSPDTKTCSYFHSSGACERPDEFMCVIWTNRFEGMVRGDLVQVRKKVRG